MTNTLAEKAASMDPSSRYIDLSHLFERIIRSWGVEHAQSLRLDETRDPGLTMERGVILTGTLNGMLVLRGTPEFAVWLRDQRQGTQLGRYPAEEVFEELVSLFCLYLFHDFWNPRSFQIGPIKPFPCIPEAWPNRPPHSSCALLVAGHRVELRLWLNS